MENQSEVMDLNYRVPQRSVLGPSQFSIHFNGVSLSVKLSIYTFYAILGDPGATSRDDAIFSGERHFWRESLLKGLNSPWALFLTKRVPEVVEIRPADWSEFFF